jgi:hypothetical protein
MEWQVFSGELPKQLVGLGGTPTLFKSAWWVRQEISPGADRVMVLPLNVGVGGMPYQVGMGDLTDDAVQSAAGTLLNYLQSVGCKPGFDPTVRDFQAAYVAAGGNLPNDSNGSSGIDGLYGNNTAAALQAVLDAGPNQPPQTAPAGCVGVAPGAGPVVVVPGGSTVTNTSTTIMGLPAWAFWTLAAVVGGGAVLVAWSVLSKGGKGHRAARHLAHHARHLHAHETRRRRRKSRKGARRRRGRK